MSSLKLVCKYNYVCASTQLSDYIIIAGEGKSSQSLGDQIIASGGVVLSEFPIDVSELYPTLSYVCLS